MINKFVKEALTETIATMLGDSQAERAAPDPLPPSTTSVMVSLFYSSFSTEVLMDLLLNFMLSNDSSCYFQPKIVTLLSCKQMRDEEINFLI